VALKGACRREKCGNNGMRTKRVGLTGKPPWKKPGVLVGFQKLDLEEGRSVNKTRAEGHKEI